MMFQLQTGGKLDLPDLASVDSAIGKFEDELARLRRLRKVVAEMTGAPVKVPAVSAPPATAAATTPAVTTNPGTGG